MSREHFLWRWCNKDRNGIGLTEAEDIKKSWQEYKEKLYRKGVLMDSQDVVITHIGSDILELECKWALEALLQTKLEEVMVSHMNYFKS